MRILAGLLVAAAAAYGHVVSMSSGELKVDGLQATYELRMPLYEIQHVASPETALLDAVRFEGARRTSGSCATEDNVYVCRAAYAFEKPVPDKLRVECSLYRVTVPNHVHLLHATQGSNSDQEVFDSRFTDVEVRFRPPSATEILVREVAAGIAKVATSPVALLFLASLALAVRGWKEYALYVGVFVVGEWIAQPLAPRIPLPMSLGFLDAAMALTAMYLALDLLLIPEARTRWILIGVFGIVHGLAFAAFPANYLTGASLLQIAVAAMFTAALLRLPKRARPWAAGIVLAGSLGLFARLLV